LSVVQPRPSRVVLFGSRARGQARPDSDIDRLVVMPQPTLTANERTSTSCLASSRRMI
jgi:predicted nucleotidyltransferase